MGQRSVRSLQPAFRPPSLRSHWRSTCGGNGVFTVTGYLPRLASEGQDVLCVVEVERRYHLQLFLQHQIERFSRYMRGAIGRIEALPDGAVLFTFRLEREQCTERSLITAIANLYTHLNEQCGARRHVASRTLTFPTLRARSA